MVLLDGISLSGEQIASMTNKRITIAKVPRYETFDDGKDKTRKKVAIAVMLSDKNVLNWYPNKESLKILSSWYGFEMDNWLGKSFELFTVKQNVQGNVLDVIHIDKSKPHS